MPNKTDAWKKLQEHRKDIKDIHMRDLFAQESGRLHKFSLKHEGLHIDFSKNRITDKTFELLMALAKECDVESWREKMFSGEKINNTEKRAALHTALRTPAHEEILVDGENIMPFIQDVLDKMEEFSSRVRDGSWKGYSGKSIKTVVNIGIGGSDLGPRMVCEALEPYHDSSVSVRFVSNIDPADISIALKDADPETTLFIIASKTFTTQETMANAEAAKSWLLDHFKDEDAVGRHFVALSTNEKAVTDFGIDSENIFPFKDWVGGRYSLWSSIGLSICIAAGFDKFRDLLNGAHVMDRHFREAPLESNIPVIMAMLGVWYRNFWNAQSYAVLPYAQQLLLFPAWLQQLDMESNGKSVDRDGNKVEYDTGPIVFGQAGTNGQHAFYQLIHQGTSFVPCDFIAVLESAYPVGDQHRTLLANMMAQSQALMQGRTLDEAGGDLHRVFNGNKPSTTILLQKLDPFHLGMLLALYEHKVFVQGVVWNINSFDQPGVELGKELTDDILSSKTDFINF